MGVDVIVSTVPPDEEEVLKELVNIGIVRVIELPAYLSKVHWGCDNLRVVSEA